MIRPSRERIAARPELAPTRYQPMAARQPRVDVRPGPLWPALLAIAVGVVSAFVADATEEAWPLFVLIAAPALALLLDAMLRLTKMGRRQSVRPLRDNHKGRIVADRRPVLLRPVIFVPPGRRARIAGRIPRALAYRPIARRAKPQNRRPAHIVGRSRLPH